MTKNLSAEQARRLRHWGTPWWIWGLLVFMIGGGCAGPLEEATRQDLNAAFVGSRYLSRVYLGSRYYLAYTNNGIAGRHPTGVFVDQALKPWYETDASFFESGSSGTIYGVDALHDLDCDLDLLSFVQGIPPGQVVSITRLSDRSDQIIVEVETAERYLVGKTYGLSPGRQPQSRASRIHLVFGKEGMRNLDHALLRQMLATVLAPVPELVSDAEKTDFILSNFPNTPLADLMTLTGYSEYDVLARYYAGALAASDIPAAIQHNLADMLARQYTPWFRNTGLLLRDVRAGGRTLTLDYVLQEMSQSVIYHSPELRAAALFFRKMTPVLNALHASMTLLADDDTEIVIAFSYPYIDNFGQIFPEDTTVRLQARDVIDFAVAALDEQGLADRADIRVNTTPVAISAEALKAVERVKLTVPTSWKEVTVELVDWWHQDNEAEHRTVIRGEVRNIGTWLAKDVTITVVGYNQFGLTEVEKSTTLSGYLKPDEVQRFELVIDMADVQRLSRPRLTWQAVE